MKLLPSLLAAVAAASAFAEPAVEDVIVRQQWPWSTDVRVDYILTGVTSPVDVTVECFNGEEALAIANRKYALKGDLYGVSTSDAHSFTIDPVEAFGAGRNLMNFRVRLTLSPSAENMGETLYRVFDLVGGKEEAPITRADILNGKYGSYETEFSAIGNGFNTTLEDVIIWTGVTNDVKYATTHLVMRKIPAKDVVWTMGSPENEAYRDSYGANLNPSNIEKQCSVKLTNDFYIGVFPITQAQYLKFSYTGTNPSYFSTGDEAPLRPVNNVAMGTMRGISIDNLKHPGPSGELINWPTNSYLHEVATASSLMVLRNLTKVEFDLPTEAQWEFACRAGTTTAVYSGKNLSNANDQCPELDEIGWYRGNMNAADAASATSRAVGMKKPNAFGLYDMAGNSVDVCVNWSVLWPINKDGAEEPLVEPLGPIVTSDASNNRPMKRGGAYDSNARYCRSAYHNTAYSANQANKYMGYRLICPVGAKWSD